jgi:hypothetical protein
MEPYVPSVSKRTLEDFMGDPLAERIRRHGILRGDYWIPAHILSVNERLHLEKRLTLKKSVFGKENAYKDYCFLKEDTSRHLLGLPRAFALSHYGYPHTVETVTTAMTKTTEAFAFHGRLRKERPNQESIIDELLAFYHHPQSIRASILQLPTASGKTVVMLYLISQLKCPALILVDREVLVTQIRDEISTFLPGVTFGILQGKLTKRKFPCTKEGKPLVHIAVGMLQSLSRNTYPEQILDHFSVVVVDEMHKIAAPSCAAALTKLRPTYLLGLSATPRRGDGLGEALNWLMGPVVVRRERDWVPCHVLRVKAPWHNFRREVPHYMVLNKLSTSDDRNHFLVNLLVGLFLDDKSAYQRHIFVLSDRLDQLLFLQRAVVDALWHKVTQERPGAVSAPGKDVLCLEDSESRQQYYFPRLIGGQKEQERQWANRGHIVFAMYSVASDGLNIPHLDCLVYATPRSDVEQSCGRILRSCSEKNVPLIVDVVDDGERSLQQWYRRRAYYRYERMYICEA